jgi:hypothetical protein
MPALKVNANVLQRWRCEISHGPGNVLATNLNVSSERILISRMRLLTRAGAVLGLNSSDGDWMIKGSSSGEM